MNIGEIAETFIRAVDLGRDTRRHVGVLAKANGWKCEVAHA